MVDPAVLTESKSRDEVIGLLAQLEAQALACIGARDRQGFDQATAVLTALRRNYGKLHGDLPPPDAAVTALQLLKLSAEGRNGDFAVATEQLRLAQTSSPEVAAVIRLQDALTTGEYDTYLQLLQSGLHAKYPFFFGELQEAFRKRVSTCLQKSHASVSRARAMALLMLASEAELEAFVDRQNEPLRAFESREGAGESAASGDGQRVSWLLDGDRIVFKRRYWTSRLYGCTTSLTAEFNWTTELKSLVEFPSQEEAPPETIPVKEYITRTLGYAAEVERII